jgi:hypothetical protein
MSKLNLTPETLVVLKNAGDKLAEKAWLDWIHLSKFNSPPEVYVECWYVNDRFEVGLSWH